MTDYIKLRNNLYSSYQGPGRSKMLAGGGVPASRHHQQAGGEEGAAVVGAARPGWQTGQVVPGPAVRGPARHVVQLHCVLALQFPVRPQ